MPTGIVIAAAGGGPRLERPHPRPMAPPRPCAATPGRPPRLRAARRDRLSNQVTDDLDEAGRRK